VRRGSYNKPEEEEKLIPTFPNHLKGWGKIGKRAVQFLNRGERKIAHVRREKSRREKKRARGIQPKFLHQQGERRLGTS